MGNITFGPLRPGLPRYHLHNLGSAWLIDECELDDCDKVHANLIIDREHPTARVAAAFSGDAPTEPSFRSQEEP